MDYYNKYLKYKTKYLKSKQMIGGNYLEKFIQIGSFKNETNKMIVSDTSYEIPQPNEIFKLNEIITVPICTWNVYIEQERKRIKTLIIVRENMNNNLNNWTCIFSAGVDTGNLGFFDLKYYRDDNIVGDHKLTPYIDMIEKGDKWYSMCIFLAFENKNEHNASIVPYGALSESGYGDGIYDIYVCYDNNKNVVALKAEFIVDDVQ